MKISRECPRLQIKAELLTKSVMNASVIPDNSSPYHSLFVPDIHPIRKCSPKSQLIFMESISNVQSFYLSSKTTRTQVLALTIPNLFFNADFNHSSLSLNSLNAIFLAILELVVWRISSTDTPSHVESHQLSISWLILTRTMKCRPYHTKDSISAFGAVSSNNTTRYFA
ncbi:uncharacterized protein LY89DRAFT_353222 [Mollisia scopiformis]|uniref:Uncharacterized protein n=1 Tax=Mollisia scopiformis TaxID=149040 RepID=A0A132B603_MOLSC|nr:uncharacterized protein LY89DRAFT_353222 [Mollisia scopiformis]KUJ07838.1 hypothetical protein LY89DRAFT_353222 [Mollisia scopiformis]